jgi:deoxyribose-phosphate aldolase
MEYEEFAGRVDHTALGPATTASDVRRLLDEAVEYGTNACVPPCYVAEAADYAPAVTLATVVGFPHGHHETAVKCREAQLAWEAGADELDVVTNVGRLLSEEADVAGADLAEVVASVPVPVKVIVETALLTDDEKRRAAELAVEADADFLKTSTGFAGGGAIVDDVALLSEYLPVKASGGVSSYEEASAMFEAGADRIGASSGVAICEGFLAAHGRDGPG